ncbi:hypothetical protein PTSG_06576 [Salpingoeca rosetta]|uniref:Uncharacterized protein n=1 Tax=Salpingoeca rosetta (strain ATCC 50818 / BSB-021) TaxID=946362 RepID=F2UG76_SALR5|nr:uncharacterized protein PTSG_06576 [Salpingoeca rosetta]EGD75504.1 hypothetical protein PTSG_06576 [Salpingoeca rosetta]|eukprot:XP_004991961.1 hypothetical protein PTSG_06576 [Salpingoeca rosetta]
MERAEVGMEKAEQEVWLLRIPEPLASAWAAAQDGTRLGEIRVPTDDAEEHPEKRPKMELRADVPLLEEDQKREKRFIPSRYAVRQVPTENLAIFAEEQAALKNEDGTIADDAGSILTAQALGQVTTRADCVIMHGEELDLFIKTRPTELSEDKMTKEASKGMTQDGLLMTQSLIKTQKRERTKTRKPEKEVKELLFGLFRKHEYYTLDQLSQLTQQPAQYLASILRTVAVREQSGEHRNKWHLRRAFREFD